MSKLLTDDHPLLVLPSLAAEIGLNEAIVLQQLHYWLGKSRHTHNGQKWVYNTINEWLEQFPWIKSRKTLAGCFNALTDRHLVVTGNFNRSKFDRTKWYSIDYSALAKLVSRLGSPDSLEGQTGANAAGPKEPANTRRLPENTPENVEDPLAVARQIGINVESPRHRGCFEKAINRLGPELVNWALNQTADHAHHPNWQYLATILDALQGAGVATVEQAERIKNSRCRHRRHRPAIVREHLPAAVEIAAPAAEVPDDSQEVMPVD